MTRVPVESVELGPHARGWFTGRGAGGRALGQPGNLSHRRPHEPRALAADRADVGDQVGYPPASWTLMRQVHGASVAVVDEGTVPGAEVKDVDAIVTTLVDRPLVVLVADCVPVLLAGTHAIAVAHAGREGLAAGVVDRVADAMGQCDDLAQVHAVVGPAIGGCCYEVPADLRASVAAVAPDAFAHTSWGTPSLDLPAAAMAILRARGVGRVSRFSGCTRCGPDGRWFSHRADARAGRFAGIVVRHGDGGGR